MLKTEFSKKKHLLIPQEILMTNKRIYLIYRYFEKRNLQIYLS